MHHHCALCDMINLCFLHHEGLESLQEALALLAGSWNKLTLSMMLLIKTTLFIGCLSCLGYTEYVDLPSSITTYQKGMGLVSLYGGSGTVTKFRIEHGVNAKEAGVHLA